MSILPNIVEIAQSYNVEIDSRTLGKREILCKCPFCNNGQNKRSRRHYLSLNESKNLFQCWWCKERGGVIRFISLLSGESESDILERIRREKSHSSYQKHPAEKLSTHQLQLLGYGRINWVANRHFDYDEYLAFREKVWSEWQDYINEQVKRAYQMVWLYMLKGEITMGYQLVSKIENDIGFPLMEKVLRYFSSEGHECAEDRWSSEELVCEILQIRHPVESLTYLQKEEL
ncbi:hypothetical protein SAMN05880501_113114 [Ureibacillus xyleni]|uniref:CHC2-type zinc finger protein n=1 Tax=Ureibacillus xyleni TaxID=614648 RepID=A0A285TJ29_9BACL|nr:hypothetical protein [Ureibacillus xyleni]SOC22032.1 hypothetical protein SAMN05880501_113114 [Ureibacillus xyleni]